MPNQHVLTDHVEEYRGFDIHRGVLRPNSFMIVRFNSEGFPVAEDLCPHFGDLTETKLAVDRMIQRGITS